MNNLVLLFDLDGTLINTDKIYCDIWNDLLKKYNINCNIDFFNNFIKGKNDSIFLKYLIPNINDTDIMNISKKKDELFINFIENNKPEILIEGVFKFIEKYKNHNIAIVTSCNKKAAQFILNYTNINNYINLLITADECINNKPHPEPYLKAINYFKSEKKNYIIFEDSFSGFTAAVNSGVPNICIIKNEYTLKELLDNDYIKINNYNNLIIDNIINKNKIHQQYTDNIKEIFNYLPNITIKNNNENVKCGYICDIQSKKIISNNIVSEIIIKISNLDNELSKTALELDMYNNELKFYSLFSNIININIPKFYGSFKINQRDAIVLESLNKYYGSFNIDLNKNINILLKVVEHIGNMHNLFYFDSKESLPYIFQSLKKNNEIKYYKKLINERFEIFMNKNSSILDNIDIKNLNYIFNNFESILNDTSQFPLSFCHGDLKSPNIFYKNNENPYFLDWQYIHLNKGISDIAFLLVESIDYDEILVDLVINYYYKLLNKNKEINYKNYINDFKNSLCIFPFFVCVWFNSEDNDKLLDPVFPIRFMKNLLKYYRHYLIKNYTRNGKIYSSVSQ